MNQNNTEHKTTDELCDNISNESDMLLSRLSGIMGYDKKKQKNTELIENKNATDYINTEGNTMLWYAVYHGNEEAVHSLLKNKRNYKFIHPNSSIYFYIRIGETLMLNTALESQCTIYSDIFMNDVTENGEIESYCDRMPENRCPKRGYGIYKAARSKKRFNSGNCFDLITTTTSGNMLKLPYNQSFEYKENNPLNQALHDNNEKIAELLLKAGTDPNLKIKGITCNGLIYSICHGNHKLVSMLLRHGATIDERYFQLVGILESKNPTIEGCTCIHQRDYVKTKKALEYYAMIRKKMLIIGCDRELMESSLFNRDYLPNDIFLVIMSLVLDPDDELLGNGKKPEIGFFAWLKSFFL